jgi:hypothetical protein
MHRLWEALRNNLHPIGRLEVPSLPSMRAATLTILFFVAVLNSGTLVISASNLTTPQTDSPRVHSQQTTNSTTTSSYTTTSTQIAGTTNLALLILGLVAIPATIVTALFVYKFAGTPLQLPFGKILKRRAPPHLRPLRVLNGAICPMCFRPMTYEPKGEDWHCEHCGVYYET